MLHIEHWQRRGLSGEDTWESTAIRRVLHEAEREELFGLVAADAIAHAVSEPTAQTVLGAILRLERMVTFGVKQLNDRLICWAAPMGSILDIYPLLRYWRTELVSSEARVWSPLTIQSLALLPLSDKTNRRFDPIAIPLLNPSTQRIAVHDTNPARRLLVCIELARVFLYRPDRQASDSVVLVDGLTKLPSKGIDVVGLATAVYPITDDWQVEDRSRHVASDGGERRADETQFRGDREIVKSATAVHRETCRIAHAESSGLGLADLHSLKSLPQHDSIAAFCRAAGQLLSERASNRSDGSLEAVEAAVFDDPELLKHTPVMVAIPNWINTDHVDIMIRAVMIARNPKLLLRAEGRFSGWLDSLRTLQSLHERAACLGVAAQAAYDTLPTTAVADVDAGTLRQMISEIEAVAQAGENAALAISAQNTPTGEQTESQCGLIEAFDRLAEIQVGIDSHSLLRAQAWIRLASGRSTPDAVYRAVRSALQDDRREVYAMVGKGLTSPLHVQLASFAVRDSFGGDLDAARSILRRDFSPPISLEDDLSKPVFQCLHTGIPSASHQT